MFGVLKKIFVFAGRKRGTLKHAMLISFLGAVFASLQFGALMLTLDALLSGGMANITLIFGVLLLSTAGRTVCFYCSTNAETDAGYHMVAEKRVHIGDRLRYIPMGYFNENSLGNITAMVTTTLGDVENTAARCPSDTGTRMHWVVMLGVWAGTMSPSSRRPQTLRGSCSLFSSSPPM